MTKKHTFTAICYAFSTTTTLGMAFTHQRDYVTWINEAKRDETCQTRILKTIEMLKQNRKTK